MEITHPLCRVKLRSLNINDMEIYNSEVELDEDYLRQSDLLWLPHNQNTIYHSLLNLINSQPLNQTPNTLAVINEYNQPIGIVSTYNYDNRHGMFSYGISILNRYKKRGYGFEAANLLLYHMFYTLQYFKCIASTYDFNQESNLLQIKLGFKNEVILKNAYYSRGVYSNILQWGMAKNEFTFMKNKK